MKLIGVLFWTGIGTETGSGERTERVERGIERTDGVTK